MAKVETRTSTEAIMRYDNSMIKRLSHERNKCNRQDVVLQLQGPCLPINDDSSRINMYLRPIMEQDLTQIKEIYAHYIATSLSCPEMDALSVSQIRTRVENIQEVNFPFIVAVNRSGGPRNRQRRAGKFNKEHIVGFAFADDYNDIHGMYR